MAERAPKPARKKVKLDSFWIQPELIERIRTAQEAMCARIGIRLTRAEVLRTAISYGLDTMERKLRREGTPPTRRATSVV